MDPKRITIQDIAEHANVSKSTVSRVLNKTTPVNELKRQAVLEAIEKLDFHPNLMASGLAGGQSFTIGLQTQKIGSPFYDLITQGVIQSLTDSNYSPVLVDGRWDKDFELEGIQTLLRRQVDGLIIAGGDLEIEHLLSFAELKPMLIAGREVEGLETHCIFVNNFDAGYSATKFLIDLGHRKIAHLAGIRSHQDAIRRLNGYKHALKEAGIPFDQELVFNGRFDGPSGVEAVEYWLNHKVEFTAIFAANDMCAFGARLALYRHNMRVPDDVSLIGIDDQIESGYMTPPLTTVRQPAFEMGFSVGSAMLSLLADEPFELPILGIEIVERESTAKVAGTV